MRELCGVGAVKESLFAACRPDGTVLTRARQWLRVGIVGLLAVAAPAEAKAPAKKPPAPVALSEEALVAQSGFAGDQVGYVTFDAATGQLLSSRNADGLFIPASVAKVPAAVAALGVLGPDYRFETSLHMTGRLANGVLQGDLYLKGGGDPYLMSEDLTNLVRELQARGVTRVAGRFFFDALVIPTIDQIDPVQPDAAQYNAGVSALTLNFNRIAFAWEHGGDPSSLRAAAYSESRENSIPLDGITFRPAPPGANPGVPLVRAAGLPGEHWLFSPQIEKAGRTWLPLRRSAPAAAQVFVKLAAGAGVTLPPAQAGSVPESAAKIGSHLSPPLTEVLRLTLKYSNNLAAELVGLATARHLTGQGMSLDMASAAVTDWFKSNLPDGNWEGYALANFSGLSSESRVTPAQVAAILAFAARQRYGTEDIFSLLPAKPWDLDEKNGKGKEPELEVRAKTGTVAYGRGLAGFIDKGHGRRIGFVVFVSDAAARRNFDASHKVRSLLLPPEAKNWLQRARGLERALVVRWANGG